MSSNDAYLSVNLKAKLQPFDRGDIEDSFDEFCASQNINAGVEGGGTLLGDNNEIEECDIEIVATDYNEDVLQKIITFFESTLAPNGSSIKVEDDEGNVLKEVPLNSHEGLGLYMNNTDLPEYYYEDYDINHVYAECQKLIEGVGAIFSHRNGNEETALYMYGTSYDEMLSRIQPLLDDYPLCEKSRVVKIA